MSWADGQSRLYSSLVPVNRCEYLSDKTLKPSARSTPVSRRIMKRRQERLRSLAEAAPITISKPRDNAPDRVETPVPTYLRILARSITNSVGQCWDKIPIQ